MTPSYMERVEAATPTRFWINNPTQEELDKAIALGAVSGTTNPAYGAALLKNEPEYIHAVIDDVIQEVDDDNQAADVIYQRISRRFMEGFLPAFERSNGARGYVTMQDDPRRDDSADVIVEYALRHAKLAPNYMAKVPVIGTGMEAMAALVERNIPVCATESFSLAQTIQMCDLYEDVSRRSGNRPAFFITHITGIYEEEIQHYVRQQGVEIAPEMLAQAGCIVGRKAYHLIKERGYHATLLGGGARGSQHFTEFVGGDLGVTMNWSTIDEMNRADPPVVSRINHQAPPEVVDELMAKIPDFRRAYLEDGLTVEEFEHFAPLLRFRRNFIEGCDRVLQAIAARRGGGDWRDAASSAVSFAQREPALS